MEEHYDEPPEIRFRVIPLPEDVRRQAQEYPVLAETCPACGKEHCQCQLPDGELISERWYACSEPHDGAAMGDYYLHHVMAEKDARRRGWQYVCCWTFSDGCSDEECTVTDAEDLLTEYYRLGETYPL